jgi:hypothetical protein
MLIEWLEEDREIEGKRRVWSEQNAFARRKRMRVEKVLKNESIGENADVIDRLDHNKIRAGFDVIENSVNVGLVAINKLVRELVQESIICMSGLIFLRSDEDGFDVLWKAAELITCD